MNGGNNNGTIKIHYTGTGHGTSVHVTLDNAGNSNVINISAIKVPHYTSVPQSVVSRVCNGESYRYGFNGQMKDNEWAGLGNHVDFGARGLDTRTGRWQSVDELFKKYPGISPYAFCLNNPNIYADKDGRDAVLIVFPDYKIDAEIKVGKWKAPKVGGLGHAGALIINNKNGQATYYEYGRYQTSDGTKGKVQKYSVGKISFDADGKPTTESLNKALGKISEKSGQGGRIDGAYIISDQYGAMKDYADRRYNESNPGNPSYNKDRDPYTLSGNNCGTFAEDCINQDPSVDQPNVWVKSPSNIVSEYQEEGNAKVTYDPKTKTTTMGKGDESDAKKGTPPPNSGKPAKK
jgi:RHS repeat-associated protein